MEKLVILKLGDGSLDTGFSVILQISDAVYRPTAELTGSLPPASRLRQILQRWQTAYRRLGLPYRLEARKEGFAKNISRVEDCSVVAQELTEEFNRWLKAETFRPLWDKLLEQLTLQDQVRIILQTQQTLVQQLPWHTWDICDRYPKAEIALSAPTYESIPPQPINRQQVRILAIFGHSQGIDIQTDQALLNHLPNADIQFLVEPNRQQLTTYLWEPQGWDILFFAGHSTSQTNSPVKSIGQLSLNPTDSLTIPELKHALTKAIKRGLKIALFNSCDGLGLAQALSDLHIPQVLVMREPVPDRVAHEFLKAFLEAFARKETFYLAVREAREKLQGLEDYYPCATWLPIICQNPAELPPTWSTLTNITSEPIVKPLSKSSWQVVLGASLITAVVSFILLGLRQIGIFQNWNLWALDQLMQLRPRELPDSRILIITITETDIQAQDAEYRRGSLSDEALSALLEKLEPMEPRVIGLDIYRDFPVSRHQPRLVNQLQTNNKLLVTCKTSSADKNIPGIAPPLEVPNERIGFSDFVTDSDGILRRHLLALTPEPVSPCQAGYGLSTLLALRYLAQEGLEPTASSNGYLQVEDVIFKPLAPNFGGYQGVDAGGHQVLLNYRNLPSLDQIAVQVTLSDILEDRVNAALIRDRIVLIGTTASSMGDYWLTPYSYKTIKGEQDTAGVFMQAHMVSQLLSAILDRRPLIQTWPEWADILWIVSWGAAGSGLVCGIVYGIRPRAKFYLYWLLMGGLMLELSLFGLCWLGLVQLGYWLPWGGAAVSIVISMAGAIVWQTQNTIADLKDEPI
ncbi:CHASE2 domain-containing protein [Leptothoe spongobia]|uniref:CHASE2 domain-containing protein n=1 Tax=Leptothoe spongobia TAU-MAC 1115 TaxID=1967444 RepID=A0A947GIJ0_9CYAN|nr:CHASE2 domain-containing protein [Leptothoe spongobia]MBT9316240.1 CHASE2 domain-containing protein [Leptothoe spongobia TAU-MAC 1115]